MATKVNRDIKYLNRDFSDIRNKLIEFSKTYFPNTYNDFSPASPGMMFMEQAAYVGDVMSFYLDNQLQETFTQFARQTNNLYELAYMFGYKPKVTGAAQATIDLYQTVPAIVSGSTFIPDFKYALSLNENTICTSDSNIDFLIEDKVDFSNDDPLSPIELSVYEVGPNGNPQYYLLKKSTNAISAGISTQTFEFGAHEQFPTISIKSDKIIKILDIVDSDGHTWYEVDYLGQEMIYDNIKNTNPNDPNTIDDIEDVPFLLKLKKVQRRFATRFLSENELQIQFGAGNPEDIDEEIIPNPDNVGLGLPFGKDKLTTAYSPTNFLFTNTYGIAPSSTTLTVRYLTGGGVESNVASNTITAIEKSTAKFQAINLNNSLADQTIASLSINNPNAASGGKSGDTIEQLRQNTLMQIATQQRTVTLDDYTVRALSMPSKFGIISKAYIEKPKLTDNQVSTVESLNMFVLCKNSENQLDYCSDTLKNNLRTYLNQYRIIGDNIEIRNAFIINLAIDFEIVVLPNFINSKVILECIEALKDHFLIEKWQINQPVLIRDLFVKLDRIEGVQTVKNILFTNLSGTANGYSQFGYDLIGATQNQVIYPSLDPSIFEIRYPDNDIKGRVVPL